LEQHEENTNNQLTYTPETLAALLEHGVSKGKKLKLEYFFYTNTPEKADALADELEAQQYSVECGEAEGNKSLFVITGWSTPVAIDEASLLAWTKKMCETGFKHDCEFDGWGTNVE
jgi:hypothetical protein